MESLREEGKEGAREGEGSERRWSLSEVRTRTAVLQGFGKNEKPSLEARGETPIGEKEGRVPESSLSQR